MKDAEFINLLALYYEVELLKKLRNNGIISEEEFAGILKIVQKQANVKVLCCNS